MNFNQKNEDKDGVKKKSPMDAALGYLGYRDRTSQEIKLYLREREYSAEEIESTIDYLSDMNYLNDEAYVKKYMEYGISKGKGLAKIKKELRIKGVDRELIDDTFLTADFFDSSGERERAYEQALKIIANSPIKDVTEFDSTTYGERMERRKDVQRMKAKVARRLETLGYSYDTIATVLDRMFNN